VICLLGWTSLRSKRWMCFQGIESVHFDIRLQPLFTSPEMWWLVWCSSVVHYLLKNNWGWFPFQNIPWMSLCIFPREQQRAVSPVRLCQAPRLLVSVQIYWCICMHLKLTSCLFACGVNSVVRTDWPSRASGVHPSVFLHQTIRCELPGLLNASWNKNSFPSPDYTTWATKAAQYFLK